MIAPFNMLFVSPQLENEAAAAGREGIHAMLPIRVSTLVPAGEVWWGRELPDVVELVGDTVRATRRVQIIHKMKIGSE